MMSTCNRSSALILLFASLSVFTVLPAQPVSAQEDEARVIEEIITIGSRSQRPVPR